MSILKLFEVDEELLFELFEFIIEFKLFSISGETEFKILFKSEDVLLVFSFTLFCEEEF